MSKICCVGDTDICPKTSSCSMVLRSACSHRHSREFSTVKEHLHSSSPRKSKCTSGVSEKDSCNGSFHLESSLNQLSLKSAEKTYSVFKGHIYNNFEFSGKADQKVFETDSLDVSCARELHFSNLSSANNLLLYKNISHKECSSDYSSATESDINSSVSLDSTSSMSRPQRFTRSSLPSARSFSGSDGEDIAVERVVRPRINDNSNFNSSRAESFSLSEDVNNLHLLNNHVLYRERHYNINNHFNRHSGSTDGDSLTHLSESSYLDNSTVQYSLFHRFRWFLCRCIYLKIIRIINFDAWFLSRIHNYGKHKAIFCFLLPLLLYLLWGLIQHSSFSREALSQATSSVISPVLDFLSSILEILSFIFSSVFGYFVQKEEEITVSDIHPNDCFSVSSTILTFFHGLSGLFGVISSWLVKTGESASFIIETKYPTEETIYHEKEEVKSVHPNREELKILATEVVKDEINSLKEFLKSSVQKTDFDKSHTDQKLQNEIRNLRLEFQSLTGTVGRLEKDIWKQSEKSEMKDNVIALTTEYRNHIDQLNIKLKTIEAKLSVLERLKNCCDKQWSQEDLLSMLEKHLILAFKNVMDGDFASNSKYYFFNEWLNTKFFSHEKLMQEINAAIRKQSSHSDNKINYDNVIEVVESAVLKYVDSIKKNLSEVDRSAYSSFSADMFSEDRVKKIVKEAIMLYDADKIGQVDYALESGGGSVLGTRCSETYVEKYGKFSIFGVPLWTNSNSPRTAIQPDIQPGRCWAFKGSQGFLVIELSATIYPTGFTLEHIPVSLSPSGSIDSAPKNFSVWGLDSEKDNKGNLLGEYWYDITGEPLQYFAIQNSSKKPYSYVELQIHSNHGNMEYTCLYRFRVHGQRVS